MSSSELERNLVVGSLAGFAELLRRGGIEVDAIRLQAAVGAVGVVDPAERRDVYWALRSTLLSRHEQRHAFDAAFDAFWAGEPLLETVEQLIPETVPKDRSAEADSGGEIESRAVEEEAPEGAEGGSEDSADASVGFSAIERLRRMDFREYGPAELQLAERLLQRLAGGLPRRRSRRMRRDRRGSRLDRRATLRAAMRSEGHPMELSWLQQGTTPRRTMFLVDVSGSMEPYARPFLIFMQAACRASRKVEAFTFGTRLTRLTRELAHRNPERALELLADAVPDWAGGTRIGDALLEFNRRWGSQGLTRGAVVVIVSDGWERGDVSTLAEQIARLKRASHTIVWVNPLAGDPAYEPLVAGMAASMPYVDVFLPGDDLASIERLAEVLEELPAGRRRAGPAASMGVPSG